MRIASQGKWFIKGFDKRTGKFFYPFYDGFNTKDEAETICNKLNVSTNDKYTHEVVKK